MDTHAKTPAWLQRVSASGHAAATAAALATAAGVEVKALTNDEDALAECVRIEQKCFPKYEAMDFARDVYRVRGCTLLCASLLPDPTIPAFSSPSSSSAIVGYAVLQRFGDGDGGANSFAALEPATMQVSKLAVAPRHQSTGVGKALLAAAISHARASRCTACSLHVDEANTRARGLYSSWGFVAQGGRLEDFYCTGRHALEMALDLSAKAGCHGPDVQHVAKRVRLGEQGERGGDAPPKAVHSKPPPVEQATEAGEECIEELD